MPLDHEAIAEQRALLAAHRRTLAHLVQQAAAYGGEIFAPPQTASGLAEARANIARVKAALRAGGAQVEDALDAAAQAALNQTSIFPTSFDLAAALAVVEVKGDVEEALDLLQRRSLLEWDEQAQRYSLHELVRVFAAARLVDADAVWLRHARHYSDIVWRAGGELYNQGGAQLMAGLALFDLEHEKYTTYLEQVRQRIAEPKPRSKNRKTKKPRTKNQEPENRQPRSRNRGVISIRYHRVACHAERSEGSLRRYNERSFASAAACAQDDMTIFHVKSWAIAWVIAMRRALCHPLHSPFGIADHRFPL